MPQRPASVCSKAGCNALCRDGSGRCPKHPRLPFAGYAQPRHGAPRLSGSALQRARAELFSRSPLCAECERQGRIAEAAQRDHIVPLAEGGTEDEANIQALCVACHKRKSAAEALRAANRSRSAA